MDQIFLKWCTGEMTISLNKFFPALVKDTKKLMSIIQMDIQGEDHIEPILKHLNERIEEAEENKKVCMGEYLKAKQEVAGYERIIESQNHPNGPLMTTAEFKRIKAWYKGAKQYASKSMTAINRCENLIKQLKKNVSQIERHNQCGN